MAPAPDIRRIKMNYLNLKGTPKEIGFQCGKYFAKQGINISDTLPPSTEERKKYSTAVKPIYKQKYPMLLEEIEGLAEGNGCNEEALMTFLLSMYTYTAMNFCTCIAGIDENGHPLLGRNSDFLIAMQSMYSHCLIQPASGYAFIGNTTGFVEMEDGMNEKGLAVGMTFIYSKEKHLGINAGMIVRILLEQCKSVDEAILLLKKMRIGSAQTFTLADREGNRAIVECNAKRVEVIQSDSVLFAVNQFTSNSMKSYNPIGIDDMESDLRLKTCREALSHSDRLSVDYMREVLSGKQGFLCQYDRSRGGDTVWSVIYDLNEIAVLFCDGNPSRKPFKKLDERLNH